MPTPTPPPGETLESVREYLSTAALRSDPRFTEELKAYLGGDLGRFLMTLELVPEGTGKLLEIGADPYFTTLLLERYRQYSLTLANGGSDDRGTRDVIGVGTPAERTVESVTLNVEGDGLPFDDEAFDAVLFCEVLEHLTNDPLKALGNINRVLRPGGALVLTTPNAARLDAAADLFAGNNMYDKYSGYGPYGRHNREYVLSELSDLLARAGFEVQTLFAADFDVAVPGDPVARKNLKRAMFDALVKTLRGNRADTGFTLFACATKVGPAATVRPRWLYRSYPDAELTD